MPGSKQIRKTLQVVTRARMTGFTCKADCAELIEVGIPIYDLIEETTDYDAEVAVACGLVSDMQLLIALNCWASKP